METTLLRYSIIDAYTLQELERRYHFSSSEQRIELLDGLYRTGILPPFEILRISVVDESSNVRQWVARHARCLNYNEAGLTNKGEPTAQHDLTDIMRRDPDPFVRACLYENPYLFANDTEEDWWVTFAEGSHLERLAMVRNPNLHRASRVLDALFNPHDDALPLTLPERSELVQAMLVSRQVLTVQYRSNPTVLPVPWDARLFSRLWHLLNQWPADSAVRHNIHLYVGTTIKTKAGIYRQTPMAVVRSDLLRAIDADDNETLELAIKDEDSNCRYIGYSKIKHLTKSRFDTVLDSDDINALLGLARNESLSTDHLEEVKTRLYSLGAHEEARWATETIERKRRNDSWLNDVNVVFDIETSEPNQLTNKINLIGKMLIVLERRIHHPKNGD